MKNYRDIIISDLEVVRKKELQSGNRFKAIAYSKVIPELKKLERIENVEDIAGIKGIGDGIMKKIKEIIETSHLAVADEIRKDPSINVIESFMNVYGIGRVKATKLFNDNKLGSIDELKKASEENPKLLNANQKKGLLYYDELLHRIPYKEMQLHEKILKEALDPYETEIVGSYRRKEETSGDIDVLVKCPSGEKIIMEDLIKKLPPSYIQNTLAIGEKKFMGICKIGDINRRIDILITPEDEYAFAVLYFTGSAKFNIGVRKIAQSMGLRMNEHGFEPKTALPMFRTESDIFEYLGIHYVEPENRIDSKNISLRTKSTVKKS